MLFSTFQFLITTVLAAVCARAFSLSGGDIPLLTLIIPALWLLPQGGFAGLVLLVLLTIYGVTLPYQPIALSIAVWMFFPLLKVVFSHRSNMGVLAITALIVVSLELGVMVTQSYGNLAGSAPMTLLQTITVIGVWWATRHWQTSGQHSWWTLWLVLPLWLADHHYAVLISLCMIALFSLLECLNRSSATFHWNTLLCWTLPSVGFAALVVVPGSDVPHAAFVVWVSLLGTAWMTDYLLRSLDESEEI